jgi:hypothetical protein
MQIYCFFRFRAVDLLVIHQTRDYLQSDKIVIERSITTKQSTDNKCYGLPRLVHNDVVFTFMFLRNEMKQSSIIVNRKSG